MRKKKMLKETDKARRDNLLTQLREKAMKHTTAKKITAVMLEAADEIEKMQKEMICVEDFGIVCIAALRYSCGRYTYMPQMICEMIGPLLSRFDEQDLKIMKIDIQDAIERGTLGDPQIDAPIWHRFLADIEAALWQKEGADDAADT